MKSRFACLFVVLLAVGCASSAEPTQADRDACVQAGHAPGTDAYENCLEELLASRMERPTGAQVDEIRTRMGP